MAVCVLLGCRDATKAQWNALGQHITLYSGGQVVKEWTQRER